jgi:hypothetical protein
MTREGREAEVKVRMGKKKESSESTRVKEMMLTGRMMRAVSAEYDNLQKSESSTLPPRSDGHYTASTAGNMDEEEMVHTFCRCVSH